MKLSAKQRDKMPQREFALSGGRYPINDKNHARNALSRASEQYARGKLTASEFKTVRAKARAKLK